LKNTEIFKLFDGDVGTRVIELWNEGRGYGSIALILKIKPQYVQKFLAFKNLKRTVEEYKAIKAKKPSSLPLP
jgi:hypothetical protein